LWPYFLAAMLVLLSAFVVLTFRAARTEATELLGTVAALTEKSVDRYFLQHATAMNVLAEDIVVDSALADHAAIRRMLLRYKRHHPEILAISLVRPDGQVLVSSNLALGSALPTLAGQASFQHFTGKIQPGTTFDIGRPVLGLIASQWVVPMRHVMRDAQGLPRGILISSVSVELLASFWRLAPATQTTSVGVLIDDGYLLTLFSLPEGTAPAEIYGMPRSGALQQHLARAQHPVAGQVEGPNLLGGAAYLNVFERLEHFPVTVFAATPVGEIYRLWWARVRVPLLLLLLMLIGGGGWIRVRKRHQQLIARERVDAAHAIRQSEEELRFLLDNLMSGVTVHGPDGVFIRCNPQATVLLGLTADQMTGKQLIDPAWRFLREDGSVMPVAEYPVSQVLATRTSVVDLVLGVERGTAQGLVWLLCRADLALHPSGALRHVVVTFADITRRVESDRHRADTEQKFQQLFENSMDAVFQTSLDGHVLAANPAACVIFGMAEQELINAGREALVDTADPRLHELLCRRDLHGKATGELTMVRGDGTRFEAEISSRVYRARSGESLTSMLVRDVSQRIDAQARLRESQALLASVFESAMDSIISLDSNFRVVLFNAAAERMFGYQADQMRGKKIDALVPTRAKGIHEENMRAFGQAGVSSRPMGHLRQVTATRADGSEFPVEASIAHTRAGGQSVFTVILRDVTQRNNAQQALHASLREKDALLKEVHHRVKNNLQVITSLLRLEAYRSVQPHTRSVLEDMQGRIRSMALLHESLYRSSTLAVIDLAEYLRQLARQAFGSQQTEVGVVRLRVALQPVQVGMDQAMPCGLLVNELISNCLKHGFPAGHTGEIAIELQPADAPASWCLQVSDTGVGLPPDFESKRKDALGLQLAADLAAQLGGTLSITPNRVQGVLFSVIFKALEPAPLVMPD